MAPTLTLHHGGDHAVYTEHPTEVARRALVAAADLEDFEWRSLMLQFASSLPRHAPIRRQPEVE